MRAAGLLVVLCAGALSQAGAAEPQPLAPPQSSPAPTEQQSATAPAGEHSTATPAVTATPGVTATPAVTATPGVAATPAVTATPVAPAVKPDAAKAELSAAEKDLIARGYKLEIRHGQRYFCHREPEFGTHWEMKSCDTAESFERHRAATVETVREMQANKPEISN